MTWCRALLAGLMLVASNASLSADWMLVHQSDYSDHYIDTDSISVDMSRGKPPGFVRIATFKYTHPAPAHIRLGSWIEFTILVIAFDCKDKRSRIDEMTFYINDGSKEKQTVNDPVLWDPGLGEEGDLACNWNASRTSHHR